MKNSERSTTNNKWKNIITVLFVSLGLAACSVDGEQSGKLRVSMTDAPAAYDEVNIEVKQVLVHKDDDEDFDDAESDSTDDGDDDDELRDEGWKVIYDGSMVINLLDYQNGKTLELGEAEVEAGTYEQIRLILGTNNTVVVNGETHDLKVPSGQQSGYKIIINEELEADGFLDVLIDFDANQSVVVAGNSGQFILKPVLRVIEDDDTGAIEGTILPLEAEPVAYAIAGGDTVSTQTDAEGFFRITGLPEGDYSLWIDATNEAYSDSLINDIEVEDDETYTFEEEIMLEANAQ